MRREGETRDRATLLRPPEADPEKAPIETVVEVTALGVLGPDIFTNARKPWHPPGARGIYGGCVIAQSLAAAQKTVADDFLVHSCHCYFLLAGSDAIPILYHVERVRDGRSFATRTVQARQRGRCIFTTTVSFAREEGARSGDGDGDVRVKQQPQHQKTVRHAAPLPEGVVPPPDDDGDDDDEPEAAASSSPTESRGVDVYRGADPTARPDERKCRQWSRARGRISRAGGIQAHLTALAYMSDSYFIGTVPRIHHLWRWPFEPSDLAKLPEAQRRRAKQALAADGMGPRRSADADADDDAVVAAWRARPRVGMLVSLDHSIYFHEPRRVRADEWMFTEMESPWSGGGRGFVMQRIFARDGTLLASCVQEGVLRLRQDGQEAAKL